MGIFDFLKNEKPVNFDFFGQNVTLSKEAVAYTQLGVERYNSNDFIGAMSAFSEAIKLMSANASLYVWRGTSHEDYGNIGAAQKDFEKALELDPTDYLAAYRLGMREHPNKNLPVLSSLSCPYARSELLG